MSRTCTVCTHRKRAEIDAKIAAATASNRSIAHEYGLSEWSVRRHAGLVAGATPHLPKTLALAHRAAEVADADKVVAQLEDQVARAERVLESTEKRVDLGPRHARAAMQAILVRGKALEKLVGAAKEILAVKARQEAMPARDVRAELEKKLKALADRLRQVRANEPKCQTCGQALQHGGRSAPATPEGPKPPGVH